MLGLQELFDQLINEQFKPNKLGARILESELEKIGIKITDAQRADLEEQFNQLGKGALTFYFTDQQLKAAGASTEEELKPRVQNIIDHLEEPIERFSGKIDGTMEDLVLSVVDKMAESVVKILKERMDSIREDQASISYSFSTSIEDTWGEALDLLQGLIVISDEAAQGYSTRVDKYSKDDIVHNILLRIHAKANQISKEILTLLRHGFADGAQARWRSLHELAVVSNFISQHGEEAAVRYIEHEAVETFKAAKQYNEYYARLGTEKISKEEMAALEANYNKLIGTYGESYGHEYGWASVTLNLKKPTFRDIEASVNLDHFRPYYKAASANIHASPIGILSRLGLSPEEDILLAGPSNIGLSDPAQSTIISLTQVTTSVLTHNVNVDFLVVCKVMAEYGKDVGIAFSQIENELRKQANA